MSLWQGSDGGEQRPDYGPMPPTSREMFGPQWQQITAMLLQASMLTPAQEEQLGNSANNATNDEFMARLSAEINVVEAVSRSQSEEFIGQFLFAKSAAHMAADSFKCDPEIFCKAVQAVVTRHLIGEVGDVYGRDDYDALTAAWRTIWPISWDDSTV